MSGQHKNEIDQQFGRIDLQEFSLGIATSGFEKSKKWNWIYLHWKIPDSISRFPIPKWPVQAIESDSSSTPSHLAGMDSEPRKQITLDKNQIEFKTSTNDFQKGFQSGSQFEWPIQCRYQRLDTWEYNREALVNSVQFEAAKWVHLKNFSVALCEPTILETSH